MYQDQGHMGLIAAVIGQEAMDPLDRQHIYGRVNTGRQTSIHDHIHTAAPNTIQIKQQHIFSLRLTSTGPKR